MWRLIWLALVAGALASGCTASRRAARAQVTTPSGDAIGGVTIAWVCEPSGDAGAVTGDDGVAEVFIFNSEPKRCVVTAAKPGYHTQQLTVEAVEEPLGVQLQEVTP